MPTPSAGASPANDVPYDLAGAFIEACDCYVVCPCWVDDDPDEGHCTGLFAWTITTEAGRRSVDGVDVGGLSVVSVSTHSGNRRRGGTTTALFVDRAASADQYRVLGAAFAGRYAGPLADLADVSGFVMTTERADIDVCRAGDGWSVRVSSPASPAEPSAPLVRADGVPRTFDGRPDPLTLAHTALSRELAVPPDAPSVTAQLGRTLSVSVGALPAGWIDVEGRSGMRGTFRYRHAPARPDPGDR